MKKNFFQRFCQILRQEFSINETNKANTSRVSGTVSLDQEERDRRIKHAADITVQRYGDVIARLAKE